MKNEQITKQDLAKLTKTLTKVIQKENESLAGMVKKQFDRADKRFNKIEKKLTILGSGQEDLKLRLDQAAYRFELETLEKRVEKCELKLGLAKG